MLPPIKVHSKDQMLPRQRFEFMRQAPRHFECNFHGIFGDYPTVRDS